MSTETEPREGSPVSTATENVGGTSSSPAKLAARPRTLPRQDALFKLATVWLVVPAPAVVILFFLAFAPAFNAKWTDLWGSFTPLWVPTLTLLWGKVSVTSATNTQAEIRLSHFRIAKWISIAYLLSIDTTVFLLPKVSFSLTTLKGPLFGVGVVYAIVTVIIGRFTEPSQ